MLKRADFSPFVSVAGEDKPALSVDDQQLCVEGLKHGDTYDITLRQGLPSSVDEDLLKDADFTVYVRDRSPSVRLAGKAYVLPSTGQQGIPLITVNTGTVKVTIYRIGDRNLLDNVLGYDFESNLYQYNLEDIADTKGEKVWTGELKVEKKLNEEITTAFPIGEAVPKMQPGVYLLAAQPADVPGDEYGERTTQWFIVSDYGLTAYSGSDGIHAFANSLATTAPLSDVEVRLIARNNEVLATTTTDAKGAATFAPGLTRGEGGLSPAMLVASGKSGDYAFLDLKQSAFDLTDRGVAGREPPTGLDAFVFTERGVYRTGETVHVTTLLRDAAGVAVPDVNLTLVVERPDGIEYRRALVPDEGIGGRALDVPIIGSAPTGTWRVQVYSDPKGSAIGDTSFLVEDYVPERLEFDHHDGRDEPVAGRARRDFTVDGRFLYGAPASGLPLDGSLKIAAADERPGFPGYVFGLNDQDAHGELYRTADHSARRPAGDRRRPATRLRRRARQRAGLDQAARSDGRDAARRARRPRDRAQPDAADHPDGGHDRREAAVQRFEPRRSGPRQVRRGDGGPRRQTARRERTQMAAAADRVQISVVPRLRPLAVRAGEDHAARGERHDRCRARSAGAYRGAGDLGPLPPRSGELRPARAAHHLRLRFRLVCRGERRHARPFGDRARQAGVQGRRHHDRRGHGAQRRHGHPVGHRRPADHPDHDRCAAGPGQAAAHGGR